MRLTLRLAVTTALAAALLAAQPPGRKKRTVTGSEVMRVALTTWMFPYVEACRKAGVLELDAGDVLDLKWDGGRERPSLCPPGSGSRRAIVIRVDHAWHGYAEKIIVSPMM